MVIMNQVLSKVHEWTTDIKGQAANSDRMYSQKPGYETSLD